MLRICEVYTFVEHSGEYLIYYQPCLHELLSNFIQRIIVYDLIETHIIWGFEHFKILVEPFFGGNPCFVFLFVLL